MIFLHIFANMGKQVIRIISSVKEEEGIKYPQYENIELENGYTRIFYDPHLVKFYFKARKSSIVLLHYILLEKKQEEFHFGQNEYLLFTRFCQRNGFDSYHHRIIMNSLKELTAYQILIRKAKGYYFVNARFFFAGSIKGRENAIGNAYKKKI